MKRLIMLVCILFILGCAPQAEEKTSRWINPGLCPEFKFADDAYLRAYQVYESGTALLTLSSDFIILPKDETVKYAFRQFECGYGSSEYKDTGWSPIKRDNPEHVYCEMMLLQTTDVIYTEEGGVESFGDQHYFKYFIEFNPEKTSPAEGEHLDFEVVEINCPGESAYMASYN